MDHQTTTPERSFHYNQVTLRPIEPNPDFQPELMSQFIHSKNGVDTVVTLISCEKESAVVSKDQLANWLRKIEEAALLRSELETDIGKIVETIHNLVTQKDISITKVLQKAMMGKLSPAEFGIDIDHLQAVGKKYAPKTVARMTQTTTLEQ